MAEIRIISDANITVVPLPSIGADGEPQLRGRAAVALRNAQQVQVLFRVGDLGFTREPGFRSHCDFEEDNSEGRITIWDNDGTTEIYLPVRQGVPILRAILAAYEARLAELP